MNSHRTETIDDYIAAFPKDVQSQLQQVRRAIAKAAPAAEEAISYRIPTFKIDGRYLIYFAGFKSHIGLYPVHTDGAGFSAAMARYASGKATLKFPNSFLHSMIRTTMTDLGSFQTTSIGFIKTRNENLESLAR